MTTQLDKFRTRWRRWLGNKTRRDGPYWTALLDSSWCGWPTDVLDCMPIRLEDAIRQNVKALWLKAINAADMQQLHKLDAIYSTEKYEKRYH